MSSSFFKRAQIIASGVVVVSTLFATSAASAGQPDEAEPSSKELALEVLQSEDPDESFSELSRTDEIRVQQELQANLVPEFDVEQSNIVPLSFAKAAKAGLTVPSSRRAGSCYAHPFYTNWTFWTMDVAASWMRLEWCWTNGSAGNAVITNVGGNGTGMQYQGSTRDKHNVGWEVRGLTTHSWNLAGAGITKCMQIRGGNNAVSTNVSCNLFS